MWQEKKWGIQPAKAAIPSKLGFKHNIATKSEAFFSAPKWMGSAGMGQRSFRETEVEIAIFLKNADGKGNSSLS